MNKQSDRRTDRQTDREACAQRGPASSAGQLVINQRLWWECEVSYVIIVYRLSPGGQSWQMYDGLLDTCAHGQ